MYLYIFYCISVKIWENLASTHNYKYLEIVILIT